MTDYLTIRARIVLLPSPPGEPVRFKTGISPNHNMGGPDGTVMDIGQIRFCDRTWLGNGEDCEAIVSFIPRPGLAERLSTGRTWRIQSALTLVGEGTVLAIETHEAFRKLAEAQSSHLR